MNLGEAENLQILIKKEYPFVEAIQLYKLSNPNEAYFLMVKFSFEKAFRFESEFEYELWKAKGELP